ncbi:MAG: hypothetical protein JKY01_10300 [Pseudomonadales bacterium]|nr:hypothetical protein [Pseudomonadales bacterium]
MEYQHYHTDSRFPGQAPSIPSPALLILTLWFFLFTAQEVSATHLTNEDDKNHISTSANPENSQCLPKPLPAWRKGAYRLSDTRDNWSNRVDVFARGVDGFFAGEESLNELNKSYARLRLGGRWVESGEYQDESDIKFRLHLPATKERYKLIIENDPEESESLDEKNRPSFIGNQESGRDSISAAIQRVKMRGAHWKTSSRLGVKGGAPLDPFVRLTAQRRWSAAKEWNIPYRFRLSYFHSDGYKAISTISFEKSLEHSLFFKAKTDIAWTQDRDTLETAQIFSIFQHLREDKGIDYKLGILGESASHHVINAYFLSAHYRKLIYKDWLYINVIPELNYPRERDYEAVASISMRLEVFFKH